MIKQNTQQQGGTLLGLIIGLIIGLAIAVVVAMAITKTSLPFSNKPGKADRSTDQEIVSDPNKPLYGNKDATRQVAKDFVKPPQKPAAARCRQHGSEGGRKAGRQERSENRHDQAGHQDRRSDRGRQDGQGRQAGRQQGQRRQTSRQRRQVDLLSAGRRFP
ncbi:hypothetical protein ACFS07_32405 [Undibacterium arcticum]